MTAETPRLWAPVRDPRLLLLLLPVLLFLALQLRTVSYAFVWNDHTEIENRTLIRGRRPSRALGLREGHGCRPSVDLRP